MKKYVLETMNAVQKYIDEEMKSAPEVFAEACIFCDLVNKL